MAMCGDGATAIHNANNWEFELGKWLVPVRVSSLSSQSLVHAWPISALILGSIQHQHLIQ